MGISVCNNIVGSVYVSKLFNVVVAIDLSGILIANQGQQFEGG